MLVDKHDCILKRTTQLISAVEILIYPSGIFFALPFDVVVIFKS